MDDKRPSQAGGPFLYRLYSAAQQHYARQYLALSVILYSPDRGIKFMPSANSETRIGAPGSI